VSNGPRFVLNKIKYEATRLKKRLESIFLFKANFILIAVYPELGRRANERGFNEEIEN